MTVFMNIGYCCYYVRYLL